MHFSSEIWYGGISTMIRGAELYFRCSDAHVVQMVGLRNRAVQGVAAEIVSMGLAGVRVRTEKAWYLSIKICIDCCTVKHLFNDALGIPRSADDEAEFRRLKDLGEADDRVREVLGVTAFYPAEATVSPFNSETVIDGSVVVEPVEELLAEGRVSRIAAIEVLCPACNNPCLNREGSALITYDLVGHSVACSVCGKACIVPLNAFSLQGNVVAREKPAGQATKREKKGRTKKECKGKAGRKTKGKGVRQPMQLSLDIKVINALNAMGVNKSELFEELLQQYEPFLDAWAELGNEDAEEDDTDELDHDEMEE